MGQLRGVPGPEGRAGVPAEADSPRVAVRPEQPCQIAKPEEMKLAMFENEPDLRDMLG